MFFDLVKTVLGFIESFRFVSCPDALSKVICINAAFCIVQNIFDPVLILGIQGTAIYVERGAADIGVAGKDILLEYRPDVYELLDLNVGKCRMAIAAPAGFKDDMNRTLRVATKFSRIARDYYTSIGRDIDIIHLNGSIEIAPILGLSDVIVDIVETGTTLRENNLNVIEEIVPISARLIANKSGFKFRTEQIERLTEGLRKEVQEA